MLGTALDEVVDELDGDHLDVPAREEGVFERKRDRMTFETVLLGKSRDSLKDDVVTGVAQAVDGLSVGDHDVDIRVRIGKEFPFEDLRHITAAPKGGDFIFIHVRSPSDGTGL